MLRDYKVWRVDARTGKRTFLGTVHLCWGRGTAYQEWEHACVWGRHYLSVRVVRKR